MSKTHELKEPRRFDFPRLYLLINKNTKEIESARIVWPDGTGDYPGNIPGNIPGKIYDGFMSWGAEPDSDFACWATTAYYTPSEKRIPSLAFLARKNMFTYIGEVYPNYKLVFAGEIR